MWSKVIKYPAKKQSPPLFVLFRQLKALAAESFPSSHGFLLGISDNG